MSGSVLSGDVIKLSCRYNISYTVIIYYRQPLKTFPYNQQWNRKVRVRGALPHTPISKNKFLEMLYNVSEKTALL